jgi:molybdate/tungstate transport system substrate-binding protein
VLHAHADSVTVANWCDILQEKRVSWGHPDPNLDPCGYRSLMVMQLAERYYERPGLYDRLPANRPEANVKSRAVDLVALLQSGALDYAWEYQSVAVQRGLRYLVLPAQVSLGNFQYEQFYSYATVDVAGVEAGKTTRMVGGSVTYGVTLVKTAPNRPAAIAFLAYLLDPRGGLAIMQEQGQPPFVPGRLSNPKTRAAVPAELQPLLARD